MRSRILPFTVLGLCWHFSACSTQPVDYQHLDNLYQQDQYALLIEEYEEAGDSTADSHEVLNLLGKAHYELKQYDQALSYFRKALAMNGTEPTYCSNVGLAQLELGAYQEAIENFDEAIRLDANNPLPYLNRGCAKVELQLWDSALEDTKKAQRLWNTDYGDFVLAQIYANKSTIVNHLDQEDLALEYAERALELNPTSLIANKSKAFIHMKRREFAEAMTCIDRGLTEDSADNYLRLYRGFIIMQTIDGQEGCQLVLEVLNHLDSTEVPKYDHFVKIYNKYCVER